MTDDAMTADPFTNLFENQAKLMRAALAPFSQGSIGTVDGTPLSADAMQQWQDVAMRLQSQFMQFQTEQSSKIEPMAMWGDPARWQTLSENWYRQMPIANPEKQTELWLEAVDVWRDVLTKFSGAVPAEGDSVPADVLPRKDRRFADARWRSNPAFALIHQTYLLMAERLGDMVEDLDGVPDDKREQLKFFTQTLHRGGQSCKFRHDQSRCDGAHS